MSLLCEMFYRSHGSSNEFLGLPLSGNIRHQLKLSVAHKKQGHQMHTGWPAESKSLKDLIEQDNNILMKTWFSNSLKLDFPESEYDALRELVKAINIPPTLYDPKAPRPIAATALFNMPDDDDFDLTADVEVRAGIWAENEQLLAAMNAEDEGVTENEENGTNSKTGSKHDKPDEVPVLMENLRIRCQTARSQVKALQLSAHKEIIGLTENLLDGFLLRDFRQAQKAKLIADVLDLDNYVKAADQEMAEDDERVTEPFTGQPLDPRFKLFSEHYHSLFSEVDLDGPQPLSHFLEMINIRVWEDYIEEFDEDEAGVFLAQLSEDGRLRWNNTAQEISCA